MSLTMTSKAWLAMASAASAPLWASVTRKPADVKRRATARAYGGSSSATSTDLRGASRSTRPTGERSSKLAGGPSLRDFLPLNGLPHALAFVVGDEHRLERRLALDEAHGRALVQARPRAFAQGLLTAQRSSPCPCVCRRRRAPT